jgi:hypothetical protein
VSLSLSEAVERLTPLYIVIPLSEGIQLPTTGVFEDSEDITLSIITSEGFLADTPLKVQGVGALDQTRLTFSFDRLESEAQLTFEFKATMDISPGDVVKLNLVDFSTTKESTTFPVKSSPPSAFSAATWDNTGRSLTLHVNQYVVGGTLITAVISSAAGIFLPRTGIPVTKMSKYSVGGSFALGIVNPQQFVYIQPVGSFTNTTSISFTPGKAGVANDILIQFTPSMDMLEGETVTVHLPGFRGMNVVEKNLSLPTGAFWRYSWNGALKELKLPLGRFVAAGTHVTATVSLILPDGGVRVNEPALKIASDASGGPVQDTSFTHVEPVGSLLGSADLRMDPMLAGARAIVTFGFKPQMALHPGDVLQLHLHAFSRDEDMPLTASLNVTEKVRDRSELFNITRLRNITEFKREVQSQVSNGTTQCRIVQTPVIKPESYLAEENVLVPGPLIRSSSDVTINCAELGYALIITVTFPRKISPNSAERSTDVLLVINGLKTPIGGMRPDENNLRYNFTAQAGSVPLTTMDSVPSVGAFISKKMGFAPRKAGWPTAVKIEFSTVMPLEQGDRIDIDMPGFTTEPSIPLEIQDVQAFDYSSNKIQYASWDPMKNMMKLLLADDVPAGSTVILDLPLTLMNGPILFSLVLPAVGIRADPEQNGIRISTNAAAGYVSGQAMVVMSVGSFTDTAELSYRAPWTGETSGITFSFTPENGVSVGDVLTISLPGFTQRLGAPLEFSVKSQPQDVFARGIWSASATSLVMTSLATTPQRRRVSVTIGEDAEIRLPVNGLTKNQVLLEVTVVSDIEQIPRTAISRSPAVGTFLQTPHLQFMPLKVKVSLHMQLSCVAQMDIRMGEYIFVSLPAFGGALQRTFDSATNAQWRTYWSGSETMTLYNVSTDHTLTDIVIPNNTLAFVATEMVSKGTSISVVVPSSSGIKLPAVGNFANQTSLTISTNAAAGPVLPTAISRSPPVGSFLDSASLRFTAPCRASQACEFELAFNASMGFVQYDEIEFRLPGFTGPGWSGASTPTLFLDGVRRGAAPVWNRTIETVSFRIGRNPAPRFSRWTLKIPANAGLFVPANGLRRNEETFTIKTNATLGPVLATSLSHVQAIGTFLQSPHLSFPDTLVPRAPPRVAVAGEPAAIRLVFSAVMRFVPGDHVTVVLPGFTSTAFRFQNVSSTLPVGAFSLQSWSPEKLVLVCQKGVPALTEVDITIPDSLGIQLPVLGVQRNQVDITIATDAVEGPVVPVAIHRVDPVGSFGQSVEISFSLPKAGAVSEITLRFVAYMDLNNVTDSVSLLLGGFTVPVGNDEIIGLFNVLGEVGGLKLTPLAIIPAGQEVVITVDTSFGIKIPLPGAGHPKCCSPGPPDCCIRIKADATAGSIALENVVNVQKVGSFSDVALNFEPPKVGNITAILFTFKSIMSIQEGEEIVLTLPVLECDSDACGRPIVTKWSINPVDDGPNKIMFVAQWVNQTKLVMTSATNISYGQILSFSLAAPFVLRSSGTPSNNVELTFSTNAKAGAISATEISRSPGIFAEGAWSYSELSYSPAAAGENTQIHLKFSPVMTIFPGTNLTLRLPGFTKMFHPNPMPAQSFQIVLVNGTNVVIVLRALIRIEADTIEHVILPKSLGIKIPFFGLEANSTNLTLTTDSPSGPVAHASIRQSPAVGSFDERFPPISFGVPIADTATDLYVNMTPTMPIFAGESLYIDLPYFTRDESVTIQDSMVFPTGYFRGITWQTSTSNGARLTFIANRTLAALSTIYWSISSVAGIRLPVRGVRKDTSGITISVLARYGQMNDVPLTVKHPVGSFLSREDNQYTSLTFDPKVAGNRTNITLNFTPQMPIQRGETVTIRLPGFRLVDMHRLSLPVRSDPVTKILVANMSNRSDFNSSNPEQVVRGVQIILVVNEDILGDTGVSVVIDGTILPVDGVRANTSLFTIATNANRGPVLPSPISQSQSVGAFAFTNVTFDTFVKAGTVSSLTLQFEAEMILEAGDTVSLSLMTFSKSVGSSLFAVESKPVNKIGVASWNAATSQIRFDINETIVPRTRIEVTVPRAVGIVLPIVGLRSDTEVIRIGSTAKDGMVPGAIVQKVQPVGFLSDTEVAFQFMAKPSNVSFIQILFTPLMKLLENETLSIKLPGFGFPNLHADVRWPLQGGRTTVETWVPASDSLVVRMPVHVSANVRCSILIPASNGVLIPYEGVRVNDPALRISTTAVDGPSPMTPIMKSQPVGSFTDSTSLSFSPEGRGVGRADGVVSIQLYFRPEMPMQPWDEITLKLPNFKGPNYQSLVVQSHVLDDNNGRPSLLVSWTQATTSLSLTLRQALTAKREFIALIPTDMGISLPAQGLRANQKELTISTNAALGPVPATSVVSSPAVGYFEETSLAIDAVCDGSRDTGLSAVFILVTELVEGDEVSIKLPGFTYINTESSAIPVTSIPAGSMSSFAQYYQGADNLQIVFRAEQTVLAQRKVVVQVPPGAGVLLPTSGVLKNDLRLMIETNAKSGYVPLTPLRNVTAVGAFFDAKVDFDKPCPGRPAKVMVTFTVEMQLEANDRIFLNFTGFSRVALPPRVTSRSIDLLDASDNQYIREGAIQWWPDGAGTLTLVMRTTALKGITWKTGRMDFGLILPDEPESQLYHVSVSGQANAGNSCQMRATLQNLFCPKLTPADVILETRLEYTQPMASTISALNLTFNLAFDLKIGDNMTLNLPGFFVRDEPGKSALGWVEPLCIRANVSESNRLCVRLKWVPDPAADYGGSIMLMALNPMPKSRFGWLEIPDTLMIRLPRTGIMKDEPSFSLTVKTDMDPALAGEVEYTRPIVHSEAVGFFFYSRLQFHPRVAGEKVSITLTFEFARALHHGDSLSVYLENFGGPSKQGILGLSPQLTLKGRWDESTTTLHLTVDQPGRSLAKHARVSIVIEGSDSGIRMPDQTISKTTHLIRTNAVEGPVKFTSIQNTQGVVKYRCFESVISMPDSHVCNGNNTVRVCAEKQEDADMFTNFYATPELTAITPTSCEVRGRETCQLVGASFSGPDKDKCCRVRGVNQLGMCTTDQECKVSTDLGHYSTEIAVPLIPTGVAQDSPHTGVNEQCCAYCENVLGSKGNLAMDPPRKPFCNGADMLLAKQECGKSCKGPAPANPHGCMGYTFGFVEMEINIMTGGSLATPEGAGMDIPPGVWPLNAGPASVSVLANPPPPPQEAKAVGAAVFFGPSGTVFPEPGIKLALPFDDSAVSDDVKNALGDGSMEFKVHKLVDGVFVPHPFPPVLVVDPVTGIKTMTVKTLGFSAYMTLIVPAARTTPVIVPNVTAQIVPRAPTPPPLRPAVAPVIPTPAPGPKPQSNIPAIVGGSIGGVIFLCCLGTGIYVFRARQGAQLQGSKSKQYRGKLTESLLGGHVVTASDSSATPSTDTTPPGSTMRLTKAQQKILRPRISEISSSLAVQGDLVMADGSNPPSYAASEIDREEVEERILAGGGALYPRPEMDSRPMLNADYVTIQADLMMADPFDSPGPSEYAPSLPPSDIDFDDDERAPAQVSFEFAKSLRSKMDGKGARSNGSGGYSTGPSAYNSDDDGPPSARSRKSVSIAPQRPVLSPTTSAPTRLSNAPSSASSATWTRPGGAFSPQRPVLEPTPSAPMEPERPNLNGPSRPNINAGAVVEQEAIMGRDLGHRPRMSLDVAGQDDII